MCESAVYLLNGSDKTLIMPEAARIIVSNDSVICIDMFGGRKEVHRVRIADANLVKHEIMLKPKSG